VDKRASGTCCEMMITWGEAPMAMQFGLVSPDTWFSEPIL